MVDFTTTQSEDEFVNQLLRSEYNTLSEEGAQELWSVWNEVSSGLTDKTILVVIDDWLTAENLDRRRPYLFGTIEYDNDGKAAVLFSDLQTIDVSIFENEVLDAFIETAPERTTEDVLEDVDISEVEDSYVDEPGLMWIPRAYMDVFTQTRAF